MEKIVLNVEGMSCMHCENRVKKAVGALAGVKSVDVSLADKKVTVELDASAVSEKQVKEAIEEQGYDVVAVNWRGLYVPKGISDDQFNAWAEKLQAVADSQEWKDTMTANGLAPFTKVGGDFQSWVDDVVAQTVELSKEIGVIQ